jgi:hypothetical protein
MGYAVSFGSKIVKVHDPGNTLDPDRLDYDFQYAPRTYWKEEVLISKEKIPSPTNLRLWERLRFWEPFPFLERLRFWKRTSESPFVAADDNAIPPKPPIGANDAASLGKKIVAGLVDTDSKEAEDLGFPSSDEATEANMTVGAGMAIMSLNLENLKTGDAPTPIDEVLKPTGEFLYPIFSNHEVRSAITVRKVGTRGDWRPVAYGARGALVAAEDLKLLESAFIVRFYARNLWFLAKGTAENLVLYQLKNNPMSAKGVEIGTPQNFTTVSAEILKNVNSLSQQDPTLHR